MRGEITNDNLIFQVKVSHHIFLFKVSTSIACFLPDSKSAGLMFHSVITQPMKK